MPRGLRPGCPVRTGRLVTLESPLQVPAPPGNPQPPRRAWASPYRWGAAQCTPEGGRRGLGTPPVLRRRGLRRCCPPQRALGLGLRRSKCLPGAGRQGGAGAARCAAALGRRRRTGARGVRGARQAASALALRGRRDSRDRPWGPGV
uniref:cDNA FLJ43210 fis, clone FEBRA2020582 n=1 Tax=Homo sapiens TaxID=9606 RepID=Q6ZUY4_HUMAN|nr:unnamed protein product [Homo sapiens]